MVTGKGGELLGHHRQDLRLAGRRSGGHHYGRRPSVSGTNPQDLAIRYSEREILQERVYNASLHYLLGARRELSITIPSPRSTTRGPSGRSQPPT